MKTYYLLITGDDIEIRTNNNDLAAMAKARIIVEVSFDYRTGKTRSRIIKNNLGPTS